METTFRPNEKFPQAHIDKKEMQYLYNDGEMYNFMDNETYEQIAETQLIDNAIAEAEEEYEKTGILLDAQETLAGLRRRHFG